MIMSAVKPKDHRDPVGSGYLLAPKKVGNLTSTSQVTLVNSAWVTDTAGSLLVGSDSFFPAKGNKSAQLKICLQHSLMDQGESSIVTVWNASCWVRVSARKRKYARSHSQPFPATHRGVFLVIDVPLVDSSGYKYIKMHTFINPWEIQPRMIKWYFRCHKYQFGKHIAAKAWSFKDADLKDSDFCRSLTISRF